MMPQQVVNVVGVVFHEITIVITDNDHFRVSHNTTPVALTAPAPRSDQTAKPNPDLDFGSQP